MKVEKHFAALVLSLAVLWASRFAPYSCDRLGSTQIGSMQIDGGSTWPAVVGGGVLLTVFLFLLIYDLVSFVTFALGLEPSFEHLEVYPADSDDDAAPVSLKAKLLLVYPLNLAVVIFLLLPFWTKAAYCS
jgi:hypothetical protein